MSDLIQGLWRIKKFTPNDEQRKAILFDEDRPMFITAAPGSGKTRVLLWRTVHLIVEKKISPDEIFLSTFTEKAAHQLKEGLKWQKKSETTTIQANLRASRVMESVYFCAPSDERWHAIYKSIAQFLAGFNWRE